MYEILLERQLDARNVTGLGIVERGFGIIVERDAEKLEIFQVTPERVDGIVDVLVERPDRDRPGVIREVIGQ